MGCDIHYILEVKKYDKWVGIASDLQYNKDAKADSRDYRFFSELAGVRSYEENSRNPLGIPVDISDLSRHYIEYMDDDGHSHSYMPLKEFFSIYKSLYPEENVNSDKMFALWLSEDDEEEATYENYRVVFFFDN